MFSSAAALHQNTTLYQQQQQQQSIYDLNALLSDNQGHSYGVDSFDLSLLNSDYFLDTNYQSQNNKFDFEDELCVPQSSSAANLALSIEIDNSYQFQSQTQFKQEDNFEWHQQSQYYSNYSSLLSPLSPAATTHSSPSPCPSVEFPIIKQEITSNFLFLPPSPPDSNGVPSPAAQNICCDNLKVEQFEDYQTNLSPNSSENSIHISYLLEPELEQSVKQRQQQQQDHQVLREFLQDTTFQRKHNLKPLALESLFGGLTQRGDIEPVISLALQHAKQEVTATCNALKISPDPSQWTQQQVQLWIKSTIKQFKLDPIEKCDLVFPENGQFLAMLSDEEFILRAPQIGSILHAQLEIWKAAYGDASYIDNNILTSSPNANTTPVSTAATTMNADLSSTTSLWNQMLNDDSEMSDGKCFKRGNGTTSSHIHLWQFLKELLASPQTHGTAIRWLDRSAGIFKIEDSVRVARLWGRRKNRPAMNYDKLSRSIRQYYKKGIMKKTERSQRLVYQFCHPYCL
ncbi:unnamed protein product [Diamesa tonsa]